MTLCVGVRRLRLRPPRPLAALLVLALAAPALAQETLEAKKKRFLESEFLKKADWKLDLSEAREASKKSGKPILAWFTASKLDPPACRHHESGLLVTDGFIEASKKWVLYCNVVTGMAGDKDQELLTKVGSQGWPWLAFLDQRGELVVAHRGSKTVRGISETAERAERYLEIRKRAAKGEKRDKVDLVIAALGIGQIKTEDAKRRLEALGGELSPEEKKALEEAETSALLNELTDSMKPGDDAGFVAAGRRVLELKKAGRSPPRTDAETQFWCIFLMKVAQADKDVALYEESLAAMKERFKDWEDAKGFFEASEKTLAELRQGKK